MSTKHERSHVGGLQIVLSFYLLLSRTTRVVCFMFDYSEYSKRCGEEEAKPFYKILRENILGVTNLISMIDTVKCIRIGVRNDFWYLQFERFLYRIKLLIP